MPPTKKKGAKKKPNKKKHDGSTRELLTKDVVFKQQGYTDAVFWYGKIDKIHNKFNIQATCYLDNGNTRVYNVHIPKSVRYPYPSKGGYLLVSVRPFNPNQADAVVIYFENEYKMLLKSGEIPTQDDDDIVIIREDEEETKKLTPEQKKKLRHQRLKHETTYLDMNAMFSEAPPYESLFNRLSQEYGDDEDDEDEPRLVDELGNTIGVESTEKSEESNNEDEEKVYTNNVEIDVLDEDGNPYDPSDQDEVYI